MVTFEVIGDDMQALILSLAAGDEVRAEAGAMMYMTDSIEMDAKMEALAAEEGQPGAERCPGLLLPRLLLRDPLRLVGLSDRRGPAAAAVLDVVRTCGVITGESSAPRQSGFSGSRHGAFRSGRDQGNGGP